MRIAEATALRGTCDRAEVGAVAVKNNRIVATGYNGSPPKQPHCDPNNHYLINGHCVRTIHAEMNVICQAAKMGISLEAATIYCTHEPCFECLKHLQSAGVIKVIYKNAKLDKRTPDKYYDYICVIKYDEMNPDETHKKEKNQTIFESLSKTNSEK